MNRTLSIIFAIALLASCAGKQKVETADTAAVVDSENVEVDVEKVAECPCGDPDWSKLPEGSDPPEQSE